MFCYILGEEAVDEFFFIQDLHLNFHSFLDVQHGSGLSVEAIMLLLPLAIGLPKVNHTWIIFPQS